MNLKPRPLALAILAAFSSAALADYNVTVVPGASANGAWSGGSPDVWTPSASGASVSVSKINTRLAAGTPVSITTAGGGAETGNLLITRLISWSSNTTLTLTAANNIEFAASLTATGNSAGLVLTPGGGGDYILSGGRITLSGSTPSLTIGGNAYTVINSVGVAGDATTTTLQGMKNNLLGRYALGSDIDASGTSGWNGGAGFEPVGNGSATFDGTMTGLGHTISGLTINRLATDSIGLIGYLQGTARDVGLAGGSISGKDYVGGLVGYSNSGYVKNSYGSTTVSGGVNVGGLEGYTGGSISNSYATGSVSDNGVNGQVGGLAGYIVSGTATNSYSTDAVTGAAGWIGGLVGPSSTGSVSGGYWDTQTSGIATSGGGTGKLTAEMKQKATYVGWNFDKVWRIDENNGYPFLRWESHPPILSAVGVSGTIGTATTLAATSDLYGDGYWIVVARNATAPTAAQVKAAATYSGVTLAASGNAAMTANVTKNFSVSGLSGGTSYDLYFAAEDGSGNLVAAPVKVQFSTTDVAAPSYQSAALSGALTVATLTFDEALVNNLASIDPLLKANVTFAADGTAFSALAAGDAVALSGSTLTVTFASALSGATNKVKVAANSLKDAAGNVLASAVTTAALDATDTAPNAFSFTAQTGAALSTATESNAITVTGINAAANISISGGEYAVSTDNGGSFGAYTAGAGTVNFNDQVKVKLTSSGSYSTAATATLAIGGVSAAFSVTTQAAPAASSGSGTSVTLTPTIINAGPHVETTLTGTTPVTAEPGSILAISGLGAAGAVITLLAPTSSGEAVTIKINGKVLSVAPLGGKATLTLKKAILDGVETLVLAVTGGTVSVGALTGQPLIMVINGGVISAGSGGGTVSQSVNADGTGVLSVTSGFVILPDNAFAAIQDRKLYAGEIAQIDSAGKINEVRLGCLAGSGATGDPLKPAATAGLEVKALIPDLQGKVARISETDDFTAALAAALGKDVTAQGQNADGVLSLGFPGGKIQALPYGDITIDTSRPDGVTLTAANRAEVAKSGVITRFAPAVGDFATFAANLAKLDKDAVVSVLEDGRVHVRFKGATYPLQPAWTVAQDKEGQGGFAVDEQGMIVYRDGAGYRQTLYPVFADLPRLTAAFKALDAGVSVASNGDGTVTAKFLGKTYTLKPDYRLTSAPTEQAGKDWWQDKDGKVLIRNGDGSVQGFAVR